MKQVLDCVRPKSKGSDSYLAATCMAGFDESDMFNVSLLTDGTVLGHYY